jgi:predicted NAD/FAD-binding protein
VAQRPTAAVVGSGLSGLVAAHLLSRTHEVTVFEARKEPGFAGWEAKLCNGAVVDIPLRMIEHNYWKNLIEFCNKLGVPMTSTNFTVSLYGESDQHFLNVRNSSQVFNIFQNLKWYFGLIIAAVRLGCCQSQHGESLGDFACRLGLSESDFYKIGVRRHFSWILSCTYQMVDSYPLHLVQQFFEAILGNFYKTSQPTLRIYPSVRRLQDTLMKGRSIQTNCPVSPFGASRAINGDLFDVVLIATEANAVSKVLPREWTKFFDEFQYHPSHVIVHRDASLMPGRKEDWRALNICDDVEGKACQITVWVNAYYDSVDLGGDVFETVNPRHQPKQDLIIRECHLQRVVHTKASAELQNKIAMAQGREGFYFCGAYAVEGLGLLEQALCSAQLAVEAVHRDMRASQRHPNGGA